MAEGAPDYFKRILLYGLYDGAATPLACDEQGRLIFVVEQVSPFARAGTIILTDDFSAGLTRCITESGYTGDDVELDDTEALVGGYSLKLTAGSDSDGYASALWYVAPYAFNKLGYEYAVRWGAAVSRFDTQLIGYTGTHYFQGQVRYNWSEHAWELYDSDSAAWVAFLSMSGYYTTAHIFYRFKVVLDVKSGTYHKFRYVGGEVDISAYSLHKTSHADPARVWCKLELLTTAGSNAVVHLDDLVFTQDES